MMKQSYSIFSKFNFITICVLLLSTIYANNTKHRNLRREINPSENRKGIISMVEFDNKKKVILIRHGESVANRDLDYGKDAKPDPVLTEKGISQAKKLIDNPLIQNPDIILVSPLSRAIQTAHTIFGDRANYYITPLLREKWDSPSDEGIPKSELIKKNEYIKNWGGINELPENNWWATKDNDIDWKEVRIPKFIKFVRSLKQKKIVIVTHGLFIAGLLGYDEEPDNCKLIEAKI